MSIVGFHTLATSFMPHGMCYLWKPGLVGLHLVSNTIIAISYFSIPIALIQMVRKRTDIPFENIICLFAAFIISCGMGHLLDIWTLWHPNYWITGVIRALTALVSLATAIVLFKIVPEILACPSPTQMAEINQKLMEEIAERKQIAANLQKSQRFLETLLESLTDGIAACNSEGMITLLNRASQTFHGLPQQPILASDWAQHYDLYQADGKTPLSKMDIPLFRALQGESVRDVEMTIIPKQGVAKTVLVNGEPITTPTGEKLGAVVAMRDITKIKQIQAQLQEREEFLRTIYDGIELAIFVVEVKPDHQFQYLGFNPACVRLTGISEAELVGKTPFDIFPEEIAKNIYSNYVNCVERGQSIDYEECLWFQSKESWWLTNLNPLKNSEGEVYRIIGTSLNITQRKHMENQLQASIDRYQLLANNSSDLISTQSLEGVYLYVSPACRQLLGYQPEELIGRNFTEFLHPEDLVTSQTNQYSLDALPEEYTRIYRFQRKDESYIWLETTNKIGHVVDNESQVIISISRDITKRKQAEMAVVTLNQKLERELLEQEHKFHEVNRLYRAVINNIQEIIFQTDQVGRWTFLSPAWGEVTGFTLEASLNKSFLDYVYLEEDRQDLINLFDDLINRKSESWFHEFRFRTQNGDFRWLEMYAQLDINNKEITGMFGALNDITERKQVEAVLKSRNNELAKQRKQLKIQNLQLQEASKLKSQFLSTMSHELRTPMNAIMGFSQMLQSEKYGKLTERQHDMVERIFNNSLNLLEMLNEILDFSRLEAGKIELNPEEFNVELLVKLTVEEMRSLAERKNLNVAIVIDSLKDNKICTDRSCLRRTLVNLLSNAIKFTETGEVIVTVSDLNSDWIEISVQDTGIGISHENLETIFEAFRQVDQTLTRQYSGTGLGLAITKSMVEMMNGTINVESELQKGSIFKIELPRSVNL